MADPSGQPPYVDIHFPVLWHSGQVLNHDGVEDAEEMSIQRQRLIHWNLPHRYFIFYDAEEIWGFMPPGPIHAILRGYHWWNTPEEPRPRLWFVAGIMLDHANRPYEVWWACDLVATYIRWGAG